MQCAPSMWTFAVVILSNATNNDVNDTKFTPLFCSTLRVSYALNSVQYTKIKSNQEQFKRTHMHGTKVYEHFIATIIIAPCNNNWVTCQQITWISLEFYGTWKAAREWKNMPSAKTKHHIFSQSLSLSPSTISYYCYYVNGNFSWAWQQHVRFQIWQLIQYVPVHYAAWNCCCYYGYCYCSYVALFHNKKTFRERKVV